MANAKRSYRQLERFMSIWLGCDAALFVLYLLFSALGPTALKVFLALLVFLLSACALAVLYLTREWKNRRSLWMVSAAVCLIVCLLVSLLAGYPTSSSREAEESRSQAFAQEIDDSIAFIKTQGQVRLTPSDVFGTEVKLPRGMLVTLLYRLENCPEVDGLSIFDDLPEDAYYTAAAQWAVQNDLINGTDDTHFSPDDPVNRQSLAVVLMRYAEMKGYDTSGRTELTGYVDYVKIAFWAKDALSWACSAQIIQGLDSDFLTGPKLSPTSGISGAQTAVILARFLKNVAGIQPPEPVG